LLACSLCPAQDQADKQQQIADHNRKAQEYLHEKRPEMALPELQAIVALDPANTDAVANIGVLLFFKGDCANAVPSLRTANAQRSGLWRVQFLLAACENKLGDHSAARADFEGAFPHLEDPKLKLEAGTALIDIYESADDLDKAAQIVKTLRTDNPTNVPLLYEAYRLHTKLAGEAMLNFGPIAVPFAYGIFGLVVGILQRFLNTLRYGDTRLLLYPFLVNSCFSILQGDSDNLLFNFIYVDYFVFIVCLSM